MGALGKGRAWLKEGGGILLDWSRSGGVLEGQRGAYNIIQHGRDGPIGMGGLSNFSPRGRAGLRGRWGCGLKGLGCVENDSQGFFGEKKKNDKMQGHRPCDDEEARSEMIVEGLNKRGAEDIPYW